MNIGLICVGFSVLYVAVAYFKKKSCFGCGRSAWFHLDRQCMLCSVQYCSGCTSDKLVDCYWPPVVPGTGCNGPAGKKCQECLEPRLKQIYRRLCLIGVQRMWLDKLYRPGSKSYQQAKLNYTLKCDEQESLAS